MSNEKYIIAVKKAEKDGHAISIDGDSAEDVPEAFSKLSSGIVLTFHKGGISLDEACRFVLEAAKIGTTIAFKVVKQDVE